MYGKTTESPSIMSKTIMNYANKLEQLGLNDKEARVYLSCLELGNERVAHIAEKAELPKSTTQDTLRLLSKKGYVSMYKKKNRQYFSASDPVILKNRINKHMETINEILPSISDLYHSAKTKANVRFFENKKGIEIMQKEMIDEAKELLGFASANTLEKIPEYFPQWADIRAKHKIPARIILSDSESARKNKLLDKQKLRQTKLLKNNAQFPSSLLMWGNKIAIFSLGEKFSILLVEDINMFQILKTMFEFMWNNISE